MVSSRQRAALLSVTSVLAVVAMAGAPVHAADGAKKKAPKPIGYIYSGTIDTGIETLAVHADYTLSLVKQTASPERYVGGVALLHTAGGVHLYVLANPGPSSGSIYEYSVNVATGAITPDKTAPATGLVYGSRLFAYDGYGSNPNDASNLYAEKCANKTCTRYGIADFHTNAKTGALKLAGPVKASTILDLSVQGDRMDVLEPDHKTDAVLPIAIDHKTGDFKPGTVFDLMTSDNPPQVTSASTVGAGPDAVAVGGIYVGNDKPLEIAVYPSNGIHIGGGSGVPEAAIAGLLTFIPHALLVSEVDSAGGPQLQIVAPDGATSPGIIDLAKPPYNVSTGGGPTDPDFVETIFELGLGVYLGLYSGPIIQGTNDVKGSGLVFNQTHPTVTGTGLNTSMAGYLVPHDTTTKVAVTHKSGKLEVDGSVVDGVAGLSVSITVYAKHGKSFKPVQHKDATLTKKTQYSASMARPNATKCRAIAKYAGDTATAASQASTDFSC